MKCSHQWMFLEKCDIEVPLTNKELEEQKNRLKKRKIDLKKYKSMYEAYKMQEEYCRELGVDEFYPWRNGSAKKAALDTLESLMTALKQIGGNLGQYSLGRYIYEPKEFKKDIPLRTHKSVSARRYHCQKCLAITEKKI